MVDTGLFDKISLIFKFLKDNSLIGLVLILLLFIVIDLFYGKNKKETRILYIIVIILGLMYILISYNKSLLNIIDIYISNIFKLTYFPSIIDYFTFVLITLFIQIISFKKGNKVVKNINLWVGILIECLFIINLVAMNNISVDLNSVTSIYENDLLLSIFQVSGILFMLWIIENILVAIVSFAINNRIEVPKLKDDYE